MKISEITDKNDLWNSLNNVDLDYIDKEYKTIIKGVELAIRLKRRSMADGIQGMIEKLIEDIDSILAINYPDKQDPDITKIKAKLKDYKNNLFDMHQKLV